LTPNFCACSAGYVGARCDVPVCFGILGNDTASACTLNNGRCIAPDTCACNASYIGAQCEVPVCYGIAANSSQVCTFKNGTCIKADTCACNTNYVGAQCEIPICFGILATNSSVCSTNGTCAMADTCACKPGYYGNQCQHYDCFSVHYTSKSTCSGNGKCNAPNTCICDMARGWEGANCNQIQCYNMLNCSNHGTCVSNNTCSCFTDWQGQICNVPVCFGINATNSSVCSTHGSCVSANTCSCVSDYIGNQCQTPVCFGKSALDSTTCNGKGSCVDANTCVCNAGYTGNKCTIITCSGVMFNSTSVCSGRGTCSAPDTCDCSIGFAGASCQEATCNGIPASSSTVCNSRGNCIGPNLCQCRTGYSGISCETVSSPLVCFGKASIDTTVCSGRGICLGNNTCNCVTGYAGSNCEDIICHGKRSSDFAVCSGNGICNSTNNCVCAAGYYGTSCNYWNCNNIRYDNTTANVCNGKGTCTAPNTCACVSGYTGDCTVPICYGRNATDSNNVCSGKGTCTAPNSCSCQSNYFGINCEYRKCFGKLNIDTTVCSGHGSCNAPNSCTCSAGYMGTDCSIAVCYGIPANQTATTCNGHGTCSAPNTCACAADSINGYWTGSACSSCTSNYQGPQCNQKICNAATTCNNRGTCSDTLDCVCDNQSSTGYWSGKNCEKCAGNYTLGSGCKDECLATTTCNNRGSCNDNGTCNCFNSDVAGHFAGLYCSSCTDGWFGSSCTAYISPTFNFSSRGDSLEGSLIVPDTGFSINCSTVLRIDTIAKLGSGARCYWPDRTNKPSFFVIQFGQAPTFTKTDSIAFSYGAQSKFATVQVPASIVMPTAIIQAPDSIGFCDGLALSGINSVSPDRRALNCAWKALSGFKVDVLNSFFANQSSSACSLTVPQNLLDAGYTFVFELTVTSFLGAAAKSSVTVTKTNTPMAIVSIAGPPTQQVFVSSFLRLEATVTLSDCFYDNKEVTYTWRQTSGTRVNPSATNGRFLDFAAYTFPRSDSARTYVFEVKVQAVVNPTVTSTETVTIIVVPQALQARIAGGATAKESKNNTIVLDATPSFDPDNVQDVNATYTWVCFTSTSSFCDLPPNVTLNRAIVSIPANTFTADTYTFNLVYSKGQRSATAFKVLNVINEIPPIVSITTIMPEKLNPLTKFTIIGLATVDTGSIAQLDLTLQWVVTSSNTQFVLREEDLLSSIDSNVLVIKPNVLTVGESYSFTLTATINAPLERKLAQSTPARQRISGGAGTNVVVANEPPRAGTFDISPLSGTTIQTTFKLTAAQWSDEDTPLQYSFGYIRPSDETLVPLVSNSLSNTISVQLPLGNASRNYELTLVCKVTDKFGSYSTLTRVVNVKPLTAAQSTTTAVSTMVNAQISAALASSSTDTVLQITAAAITTVQQASITPYVPAPGTVNGTCPNSCSGKGTCNAQTNTCTCNTGYALNDCSITVEELNNRQKLREDLTTALTTSLAITLQTGTPVTSDIVSQYSAALVDLSAAPAELNTATKLTILSFVNSIASLSANATGQLTTTAASSLTKSLGSLAASLFTTTSSVQSNSSIAENKALAQQMTSAANTVALAVLQDMVPGEVPLIITSDGLSIGMSMFSTTTNTPVVISFGKTGTARSFKRAAATPAAASPSVTIPGTLGSSLPKNADVGVVALNFDGNPYAYAPSSKNVSSAVFGLSVFDTQSSAEIPVNNITRSDSLIQFTLSGSFTQTPMLSSPNDTCIIEPVYVPTCRYWDDLFQIWRTDGCKHVEVSPNNIGCKCNKIDTFAALVEFALPEINLLTPSDLLLITQLNVDNMAVVIILAVVMLVYILLMLLTNYLDYVNRTAIAQEEREHQVDAVFGGRVRLMIEIIKNSHLWGSLFFRPTLDDVFTRPRRLTFAYMILITVLGLGAMFHQTKQTNVVKSIMAGIISSLVSFPPTFIAIQLWIRIATAPVYKKTLKPTPLHMFEMTEFDKNELSEDIEIDKYNRKEIEMKELGLKAGEVLMSPTSTDKGEKSFAEQLLSNDFAKEQIDTRTRKELRIRRLKNLLYQRRSVFSHIADRYNNLVNRADNAFDSVEGAGRGILDRLISGGITPFATSQQHSF